MPAILEAIKVVFSEISDFSIKTFVDFGAGPGTGFLAATAFFPIEKALHVEHDPEMIRLGIQHPNIQWDKKRIEEAEIPEADLGLFSYSLGEVANPLECVDKAFSSCRTLVIIEPGSQKGFSLIKKVRDHLLGKGGHIVAPCPHANACPIVSPDWCHFAARVERSREHRLAKEGIRNYEDEKFSYVIFTKEMRQKTGGRILARPELGKGHTRLKLCTEQGLVYKTYTKSQKEVYKLIKKAKWGTLLPKDIVEEGKDKSSDKTVGKSPNPPDHSTDE